MDNKKIIKSIYKFLSGYCYFENYDIQNTNKNFKNLIKNILNHIEQKNLKIFRLKFSSCGCDDIYCVELFNKYELIDLIVFDFDFDILGYMEYMKQYDNCKPDILTNDCNDCFCCKYIGKL